MFSKKSVMYSILKSKCPRCHEGDFFKYPFYFSPKKITTIHDNCPHCNLKYMIEPSFFFGAMYVGYAIAVALSVMIFMIAKLIFNASFLESLIAVFVIVTLMTPFNLRVSRVLWIHMFVKYEEKRE